jgi:DNA-binding IclR family transcriptional regulator
MDLGSAGHALRPTPEILKRGWVQSVEEREKGVASVSAPVLLDGKVVAAVSVSGPVDRTTRQPGRRYAAAVMDAALAVERALG